MQRCRRHLRLAPRNLWTRRNLGGKKSPIRYARHHFVTREAERRHRGEHESMMEPFSTLINKRIMLPSQKSNYIAVDTHYLSQIFQDRVGQIFVDESWYMGRYPDVIEALDAGKIKTISDHYSVFGYYEHRMPYHVLVDEEWYLAEYKDIQVAVKSGTFASGQSHFDELGYKEGRIPYPFFRLKLRSDKI